MTRVIQGKLEYGLSVDRSLASSYSAWCWYCSVAMRYAPDSSLQRDRTIRPAG